MTSHNPFPNQRTCSGCIHFSEPGQWSARCQLVEWDWSKSWDWNVAEGTRRAGNSCARWADADESFLQIAAE